MHQRKVALAGAAHIELVSGVVQLRPEDAMFDAMLRGWRAQQKSRGLKDETIDPRERLIRRFLEFANEYPWQWTPAHLDEWSASLTSEKHLAPSTVRSYQGTVRLFTELLIDARYGWGPACEEAFGTFPVAICHEWKCATRRCLSGWRWKTPSVRRRSGGLKLEAA
ncbi:phage integrase N-terminal SAM-like domain-containing protein [Streptomyces violascens]|uniref:phage integrase N-terminal SAM-like domain-containing protein n=1 Tax=Streptomyces violascens TaxID=67381 RepID=UPI003656AE27